MASIKIPSRSPAHSDEPTLPLSVQAYLDNGTGEGSRNNTLFAVVAQLRDIGMTEAAALETVRPRAIADGLKDGEISHTIRSAFAVAPRPAPQRDGSTPARILRKLEKAPSPRPSQNVEKPASLAEARPMPLPTPTAEGFKTLLLAAFKEGDGVCIATTQEQEDGRRTPKRGVTLTRERWLEKLAEKGGDMRKLFGTKDGLFIRVNPMAVGGEGKDADVTAFRHVLVEFDKGADGKDVAKDLQLGAILHTNLPITAILDSGNKSIHAWVKVDAANAKQFAERVDSVFALFDAAALDEGNKNPSRFSRCPQGFRTEHGTEREQTLLATGLGSQSWAAWETAREEKAQSEADVAIIAKYAECQTASDLRRYDVANDPNAILGAKRWLCKGGSVIFSAQTGVGKSSLQMTLVIGWALQREDITFNIPAVKPLKSLVIQAENDEGDMAEAYQGVTAAHKLTDAEHDILNNRIIFRRVTTATGKDFVDYVAAEIRLHKPDICWIDPLLNFFGGDINKSNEVSQFCTQWLNPISSATGVIFAIMHHTGKPPKETKNETTASDAAYAGLGSSMLPNWTREVVSIARMNTANENDPPTFSLTACKRRTRAGMRHHTTGQAVSKIFIRHATDGRIAWEQCEEPEAPAKAKRGSKAKATKDGGLAVTDEGGKPYTLKMGGKGKKPATQAIFGVLDVETPATGESSLERAETAKKSGGQPKLTDAQRDEIRLMHEAGALSPSARKELAARFDVNEKTIRNLLKSTPGNEGMVLES